MGCANNAYTARIAVSVVCPEVKIYVAGVSVVYDNTNWLSFQHNKNTAVDSNGKIKAASPIIKLFTNIVKSVQENPNNLGNYGLRNFI